MFLPGFLTPPSAYSALLEPLRSAGVEVEVPHLYSPTAGITGRYTVAQEVAAVVSIVQGHQSATGGQPIWIGGHSRGGQAAWRAAEELGASIAGLIVIDPVDGSGPRARTGSATDHRANIVVPTLIVGAGRGGKCAPAGVNHEAFAASLPTATHVVIEDMGHADILSGSALRWGRRLCRGGAQPERYRQEVSALMLEWLPA